MTFDRDSPIPLYQQLYDLLRDRIMRGDFAEGKVMPTEMELAQQFSLSRVTIRRALQLLVNEGLILRQAGKGSFVCPQLLQENLSQLRGFAEMMLVQYPDHVMEILGYKVITAPQHVYQVLALKQDTNVVCINRRHVLNHVPLAYTIIYLPLDIGGLLTPNDVSQESIYSLIAQKTDSVIRSATQTIGAIPADQHLADRLDIALESPVLEVKRVTYSTTKRPLEYILLYYPGGRHELSMEVFRDSMRLSTEQDIFFVTQS
ncbi:GntR family transcriptional regulator [Chloroflexota bacterium]